MQYKLTALAVVEVVDDFQREGDNIENNRNTVSI